MNQKPWEVKRFEEKAEGWEFLLSGSTVIFIQFGGCYIDLQLNDELSTIIRLEMPFKWEKDGISQVLNPKNVPSLYPMLDSVGKVLIKAESIKSGFLSLEFTDGVSMKSPFGEDGHDYEAWEVRDNHGYLVVCAIGGEVFICMPTEAASKIHNRA